MGILRAITIAKFRKEISKKKKVYFYDLGVRNSIIQQYQPLSGRTDRGGLWENFLVAERMKYLHARLHFPNRYFWRTHDHQELDYLEESDGQLHGYEFKWKPKSVPPPVAFSKAYPEGKVQTVHRENFEAFISEE